MWFAENISWRQFRRSLGAFSAIVCKDGSTVWAEDSNGKTIASGESGVDDAGVIQSALDVANKIYIKKETYIIKSSEAIGLIIKSNSEIIAEKGTIFKIADNNPATDFQLLAVGADELNILIRNLELDGNKANNPDMTEGYGLTLNKCKNIVVENVIAHDFVREGFHVEGQHITIRDCMTYNNGVAGIYFASIQSIPKDVTIERHYSHDETEFVYLENSPSSAYDITIKNSYASDIEKAVFDHGEGAISLKIYDCVFENIKGDYGHEAVILSGSNSEVKDCTIRTRLYTYIGGIFLGGQNNKAINNIIDDFHGAIKANNAIIKHNRCYNCNYAYKDGTGGNLVVDNEFHVTYRSIYHEGTLSSINYFINNYFSAPAVALDATYDIFIGNRGEILDNNSGTATFSGDGSTTDFEIGAHGLAITDPSKIVVKITPVSSDAIAASPCVGYVDPADNTKIRVKFASAPASGTGNVKITWEAQVIS